MPYINVKTSARLENDVKKDILKRLSKAGELIPGKSEAYIMAELEGEADMIFSGDLSAPCAMAEVKLFGKSTKQTYQAVAGEICKIMSECAGVDKNRCYVKFDEVEYWGMGGFMF